MKTANCTYMPTVWDQAKSGFFKQWRKHIL